jgi:hypothetical protein
VDGGDEGAPVLGALHAGHVVDVGAADEGLAAGARQHHDAQVVFARQAQERLGEVEQRRRIERIQLARIVEHDVGDRAGRPAIPGNVDLMDA